MGENIGDLGGLTIGHKAYVIAQGGSADRRGAAAAVPQLGLLLAHQAAQGAGACSTSPSTRTRPPEFRANIVRNLDEFHEVYDTAEGDGLWLDPEDRVRIW